MRKLLLVLMAFLLVGCMDTVNTPSKKVENFLSKYQNLDNDVLTQLEIIVDNDNSMRSEQKKEYKALIQKQYQNLAYKIKDEKQHGNDATVEVEIEVYDYQSAIERSKKYYEEHKDEFISDDDKDGMLKYVDYKIKSMKDVEEKVTYEITFYLEKKNGKYKINKLSESDMKKLHGIY